MDESSPQAGPPAGQTPELRSLRLAQQLLEAHGQLAAKAGTFLGLLITALYFIKAGAIPLDSLSSLGALAVVVALIALFSALAFLVLWVMPPAVALTFQAEDPHGYLKHWFQRSAEGQVLPKARQWRRVFLFSFVMGAVAWMWFATRALPGLFNGEWLRWGSLAVSAAAAGILCWKFTTHPLPESDAQSPAGSRLGAFFNRLLFVLTYAGMCVGPLLLFLTLLTASDLPQHTQAPALWALLAAGFVLASLANGVGLGAFQQLSRPRAFVVLAWVGIFTLAGIAVPLGSSHQLLNGVMQMSTIRMANVSLALDDKNCATARMLGVLTTPAPAASSPADGHCLLENVTVISRVGERWVIACDRDAPATDQARSPKRRNFRIEAKGVVGEVDTSEAVRERTGKVGVCG